MKCIRCDTDNTLKDRTDNNGRCKNCQHPFVFEPTSMTIGVKVTDPMFARAIADLSANDTLFFTPKQLFYVLDKRLQAKNAFGAAGTLIFSGVVNVFLFFTLILPNLAEGNLAILVLPVILNLIFLLVLLNQSRSPKMSSRGRAVAARCLQIQAIAILVVGFLLSLAYSSFPIFAVTVVLSVGGFYLGRRQRMTQAAIAQIPLLEPQQFQEWLTSWQQTNPINKILPPPKEENAAAIVNPDVTAYSFDRLVVTDSAAIAQLLIANNFHFENNCAILSITGYPQSIFQTTMDMLRRNPELKVYAFHDCSGKGMSLMYHLRTSPNWFQNTSIEIFDVGLLPRQVITLPNVFIQSAAEFADAAKRLPATASQGLAPDEIAWLETGNAVLLESFTPQRLIQALNRGIAVSRGELGDSSSGSDLILIGDSGTYYTGDSFG